MRVGRVMMNGLVWRILVSWRGERNRVRREGCERCNGERTRCRSPRIRGSRNVGGVEDDEEQKGAINSRERRQEAMNGRK